MRFDDSSINKICILAWGLIGDVLVRVSVMEALRQRFPHAIIDVVVDPASRGAVAHHPDLNQIIPFSRNKSPLWRYLFDACKNILALRRRHYDLCINLYCGGSSPLISRLIGARYRLSYNHTRALRWANNLQVDTPSFCSNWTKALGKMLAPLGIPLERVRQGTSFYCSAAADAFAEQLLSKYQGPFLGLNLGARVENKRWPIESYVELMQKVCEKYDYRILLFTNPGMTHLADEFEHRFKSAERLIRLPLCSLDEVGAIMKHCAIMVTGDTSLMHMAFGLKRPTLVLFTQTRPEIVEPEDCLHEDCFIADPSHHDPCGNPLGSRDIPVASAFEKFDMLASRIG